MSHSVNVGLPSAESQGQTTNPVLARMRGAPGTIRTCNLLIRSQMLYPLSYGRLAGHESNRIPRPLTPEASRSPDAEAGATGSANSGKATAASRPTCNRAG